jgi:TRAP-type C4-dicarboxylate transport system substrate-binding protein
MNKNKWNSLQPDLQKTIMEVSREYVGKLGLTWDDQAVAGVEYCKSLGNSVFVLPKDEASRWTTAILPVVDARLKNLANKGFAQKEIEDGWNFFKSRVEYWNGQQGKNNITPLLVRMEKVTK